MENKALAVIERHEKDGALVFMNEGDLQPQTMFKAVVTKIPVVPTDFHDKPINGEMLPKAHHVQKIADAAGVSLETINTVKNDTSWTVTARASRRGPDGLTTSVTASYDYDWVERAKDGPKKFALQRAETGAHLRAIRKILGLPVAFNRENFQRAVVVCRIVVDTGEMLKAPETRQAALSMATGAVDTVFGPEKDVTPQIEAPEVDAEVVTETVQDVDDFATFDAEPEDNIDNTRALRIQLEEWLLDPTIARSKDADKMIRDVLGNADATAEDIQAMIDRCTAYVAKHKGGAA